MDNGRPDIHSDILSGYGLIEAPIEQTAEQFGSHARADQTQVRLKSLGATVQQSLDYLSMRSVPATRLVLVDLGNWTAVLTNHRTGSDFADHQFWATRTMGVRTIRVVDHPARWWRRGKLRERLAWEARIVAVHAPDGSTIRSIADVHDGDRWVFETFGRPQPIEATFDFTAPRKKDRFTSQNLHDLLTALGPGPLTEERFLAAPRFGLLAERINDDAGRARVERAMCTLEQRDDPVYGYYHHGLGYVPFMKTHATSVIQAFERAVEINPRYEPLVREHLAAAYRIARN